METKSARKSLVTGGAGFIGSHVVDALVEAGDEVVVIDDLSTGSETNLHDAQAHGVELRRGDLSDRAFVDSVFAEFTPERIFHLAAQADVRRAVEEPAHDAIVNVIGTVNLLDAAAVVPGAHVVFAATGGAVYGEGEGKELPFDEGAAAEPETPYGASKFAGEVYLGVYRRLHGLPGVAMRFGNVYGPRQDPHGEAGVVAIFCGRILDGESPTVFGDGLQTRDYVYVGDVVEAMLTAERLLAERGIEVEGPFNVGTGEESSVLDLLDHLLTASDGEIKAVHEPARKGEVNRIAIDPSRAQDELGWTAKTSLGDGLRQTLESVQQAREAKTKTR